MAEISTILIKPETENMNALKDTLRTQQSLLQKLYNELDEERESSATAASEALSMILRLEGQKAAVEMEANQYKRMSDEKMFHVEETLSVFEDLMYKKEMEIAALEFQVQAYRCKLLSMGCTDLGVFEAKFSSLSEYFPLQKSETCNGDMGISETERRNSSLPPISLKDVYLKLGVVDRDRSTSPMSNIISKTSEGSTDKYLELSSENSVVGNFDSYWEQIKKLDERVKEMSNCNLGIVKGEPISCSLSSKVSYDKKVGHHQNLLKTESTISTSPSPVQDIFEVPQIHHDRKSYGKQKKDNVDWIMENDNRLEKPHIIYEDEKGCASNTLHCANIEKLISSIAYESEMKQLAMRMDRIENERRNVRHEISDHGEEDGIKLLLKEMREQLNSIQSDMKNLRKTKKYAAPDDPGLRSLKESEKLASTSSFSLSHLAQHQLTWRYPPKPNHNSSFNFPFNSTSNIKTPILCSNSFPLNLNSPSLNKPHFTNSFISRSLQLQALPQLEKLETSSDSHIPINGNHEISQLDSSGRVFVQDPPWISSLFMKKLYGDCKEQELKLRYREVEKRRYRILRRRQVNAETEAWEKMVQEYRELEREMCEKKLAPNLPYVKSLFLGWFEPLRQAIEKEQNMQRTKKQKAAYAPHIELLAADKMALIVMHKMMALVMMGQEEGCVRVVQAAVQIGMAIEQEVRIQSFLDKTKNNIRNKSADQDQEEVVKEKRNLRKRVNSLIRRKKLVEVQQLVKNEEIKPWGRDTQAKLGSCLIELLTETAYVQPPIDQTADCPPDVRPAFRHIFKTVAKNPGQKIFRRYGVIECDQLVLVGLDKTAKHMVIPYVPMLIPPRRWKGYDKGGYLFLPSYIMRTHGSKKQQDAVKSVPQKNMQKVFEALDTLGFTKWRVNRKVLSVVESIWARGGNIAGLIDREDVLVPKRPSTDDITEVKKWRWDARKARKINQERHSQRCDIELKLSVARKLKDEEGFYYPHNLDFRGRAYPMHPHLNHLSSDLCRGILEFAEGRQLGKSGLRWLKIHLANLYGAGVEKLSYDGRLGFVENHLNDILDSADNPINGNRWWLTAEDPFQCLAACINLSETLKSSSPQTVISHLPIHQDGSCNGLQHYAALGRDSLEAAAVNLVIGDKPADVYSEIAARVHDIMIRDSNKDPATNPNALLARALIGQVDRRLVKQTVMTSVYGVTYVGAREQIKRRLEEKGHITDDRMLFSAACYAAKVALAALGEIFGAARGIMGWLGDCAKVIASENQPVRWTTPLGLPVVQPYCKNQRHLIRTSLQVLALQRESDVVEVRKQRTAFPPNFVHSLDGSHMMMTAVACRDAGLRFAGVHDSFWTHACDVDTMNQILREKFVELYRTPILENLLESFQTSYPDSTFPPLPERGNLDLEQVLKSPYFFN